MEQYAGNTSMVMPSLLWYVQLLLKTGIFMLSLLKSVRIVIAIAVAAAVAIIFGDEIII